MENVARRRYGKGNSTGRKKSGEQNEDKTRNLHNSFNSFVIWTSYMIFFILIYLLIHTEFHSFPTAVMLNSSHSLPENVFHEEFARRHLENITSYGPRPTGSYANEVKAKTYLMNEINKLKPSVHSSKAYDVDLQITSGSFHLVNIINTNFYSVYRNVQNIVVKLSMQKESDDSLLINCHFDSVSSSPGAGDNAVSCSVMLEILRVLSQSSHHLKHNVIFLFNGAEENILQASHGFITQHKWADSVKAVINLDSAGAGGWEAVFQTGPEHPWLVAAYAEAARYPFGMVFGQEIFQSGIIPSDTDFRIFRDFGRVPGLDIAHISNGYIYHTLFDQPKYIPEGCLQRGGENILGLVLKLSSSPKLVDPGLDKHGSMVFFDIIGKFFIYYPMRIGVILNYLVVAVSMLRIYKKSSTCSTAELCGYPYICVVLSVVIISLLAWCLSTAALAGLGLLLSMLGSSMFWFTNSFNIFFVYALSALAFLLSTHHVFRIYAFKNFSSTVLEELYFDASLMIWSMMTLALTIAGLGSAYIPMFLVLFPLIVQEYLIVYIKTDWKRQVSSYIGVNICSMLLPGVLLAEIMYCVYSLFVPIMGRSGTEVPSDIVIAVATAIFVSVFVQNQVGGALMCRNLKQLIIFLFVSSFLAGILVTVTPLGFPFSGNPKNPTPQRMLLFHIDRNFHNAEGEIVKHDSGVWHLPFDYLGPTQESEYVRNSGPVACDGPNCGLPYLIPITHVLRPRDSIYYLSDEAPVVSPLVKVKLVGRRSILPDVTRLSFQVSGPDHMTMYVSPKTGVQLVGWSIDRDTPTPVIKHIESNETIYFVYYSYGLKPDAPWEFYLDLKKTGETKLLTDLVLNGHYLHGDQHITPLLKKYISTLPDWVAPNPWVGTYNWFQY